MDGNSKPCLDPAQALQWRWRGSEAQVVSHLRDGHVINAIKHHRTVTGLGLKESKEAVEAIGLLNGIMEHFESDFGPRIRLKKEFVPNDY